MAVPLYLRYLGVEAYGIIGVFTSISVLSAFLDLGLGATLTRELARLSSKDNPLPDSRNMVCTFELAYALIAVLIGLLIAICSSPVAQHWVQSRTLDPVKITRALELAGISLACQWPTNLYAAGLIGVHRQTQLGVATMLFATIRVLLTISAMWFRPDLESFFWAQIFSAFLQTIGTRYLLWHALRLKSHRPQLRLSIIQSSIRFAGGMTGITITSIILTQTDKVILSKALTLTAFGVYVVASTLATGLYMLISPMFSVMYPRFSALVHEGDRVKLSNFYHTSSQVMAALVIPVAMIFIGFAQEILYIWTGNHVLSAQGRWVLAFLILGNACNGIMNTPYALQLASGWTKLSFWVNMGAIVLLMPAIWLAATHYGAVGGAAVWAVLNLGYVLLTPHIMHRHLLTNEKREWYSTGVVAPALISAIIVLLLSCISLTGISRLSMLAVLATYWSLAVAVVVFVQPRLRNLLIVWIRTKIA